MMLSLKTAVYAILLCLVPALFFAACEVPQAEEADYAFFNVNVIPMDQEQVIEHQTVLVHDDEIVAVGDTNMVFIPEEAEIIDARGRYMIPGLSEMHAHVPSGNEDRDYIEEVLFLYLSNGITTIRSMLGDPLHLELQEQSANDEIVSPRILTSGPSLSGGSVDSPEEASQMVESQYEEGYDLIKIHPGLTEDEYMAAAETANELGMEFSGHIPVDVGLDGALEAGQSTIDHLDRYMRAAAAGQVDPDEVANPGLIFFGMQFTPYADVESFVDLANRTREAGVWNVPTNSLLVNVLGPGAPELLAERDEMQYVSPETVDGWIQAKRSRMNHEMYDEDLAREYLQYRRDITLALHEQGAGLLLGSDAPQIFNVPGFAIQHEMRDKERAGLSPYDVLGTGTTNVAEYMDEEDRMGTIESGKVADLVLLGANPLEDIEHAEQVEGVMYRGNWLPGEEIQRRLDAIAGRYAVEE